MNKLFPRMNKLFPRMKHKRPQTTTNPLIGTFISLFVVHSKIREDVLVAESMQHLVDDPDEAITPIAIAGEEDEIISLTIPALYSFIAGSFGTMMNILLKAVGEFTQPLFTEDDDGMAAATWNSVHPYWHIGAVAFLAVAMISYMNQGLARYKATVFLPMYNTIYIMLSSIYGAIFFREFEGYGTTQWVIFPLGVIATVGGIAIMSMSGAKVCVLCFVFCVWLCKNTYIYS